MSADTADLDALVAKPRVGLVVGITTPQISPPNFTSATLQHTAAGLGDTTLLKEGISGAHRSQQEVVSGRARVADPSQEDMFAMLQCRNPHNEPDAWFGHQSIDPSAGKRAVPPPCDHKGRKDLFLVMSQAEPAPPAVDGWMGNTMIDPWAGKKPCAGPEQRMGRKNLFPVIQNVCSPAFIQTCLLYTSPSPRD